MKKGVKAEDLTDKLESPKKKSTCELSADRIDKVNCQLAVYIASLDIMHTATSSTNGSEYDPESLATLACDIKNGLEEIREILNPAT